MFKLQILLLTIAAVQLSTFDPEDAKYLCAAYSSDKKDKYIQKESSEVIYYDATSIEDIKKDKHFLVHQGRCGHVYCSDNYACICHKKNIYYNLCHMRSLGVFQSNACICPDVNSEIIIKNPEARSNTEIEDYLKSLEEGEAANE